MQDIEENLQTSEVCEANENNEVDENRALPEPVYFVNVKSFGAKGDGVSDDTVAVQSAINHVYERKGGCVLLPDGKFIVSQIRMKSMINLTGVSWNSVIKQKAGSNKDLIVLDNKDVIFTRISNICIEANKWDQTVGGSAIYYDNNGGKFWVNDSIHTFENLFITDPKKNGIFVSADCRECRMVNVFVNGADEYGFDIRATDCTLVNCTSGASGKSGFRCGGPCTRYISCKAFGSGRLVSGDGSGFYISQPLQQLIGCQSQDNKEHGFLLYQSGANKNILTGCQAESNKGNSFRLDDSANYNRIDGMTNGGDTNKPYTGLSIARNSKYNVVNISSFTNTLYMTEGDMTDNSVTINQQNSLQVLPYAKTIQPNPYNGSDMKIILTGDLTIKDPKKGTYHVGTKMRFILEQDATGGRKVTFEALYRINWNPNTSKNKVNIIDFIYDGVKFIQVGSTVGL